MTIYYEEGKQYSGSVSEYKRLIIYGEESGKEQFNLPCYVQSHHENRTVYKVFAPLFSKDWRRRRTGLIGFWAVNVLSGFKKVIELKSLCDEDLYSFPKAGEEIIIKLKQE